MSGYAAPARQSDGRFWLALSVGFLVTVAISCPPVFADDAIDSNRSINAAAEQSVVVIGSAVDGATSAGGPERMARPSRAAEKRNGQAGKVLKEVGKQTIDQPGHFLIGAAPIWAARCLVGVPWYGWLVTPLLAYREWLQWPSKRWWDPPLDWAFLSLGAVVATWRPRSTERLLGALPRLRRRVIGGWSLRLVRRRCDAGTRPCLPTSPGCRSPSSRAQCSSRSRIPAITRRMPITSVRLGHSWNRRIEAANVNTSSIWPSART